MLWWIFQQSLPCLYESLIYVRFGDFVSWFFFWLRVFSIVSWGFFRPRLNILVFSFKTRKINLLSSAFPLRIEEAIVSNQFLHPATSLVGARGCTLLASTLIYFLLSIFLRSKIVDLLDRNITTTRRNFMTKKEFILWLFDQQSQTKVVANSY